MLQMLQRDGTQAVLSGDLSGDFYEVYECPFCGKIDWKAFRQVARKPPPAPI